MGCSCKQTPFQKLERRLISSGWSAMTQSDYLLLGEYIFGKLGVRPKDNQETQILYPEAKKV